MSSAGRATRVSVCRWNEEPCDCDDCGRSSGDRPKAASGSVRTSSTTIIVWSVVGGSTTLTAQPHRPAACGVGGFQESQRRVRQGRRPDRRLCALFRPDHERGRAEDPRASDGQCEFSRNVCVLIRLICMCHQKRSTHRCKKLFRLQALGSRKCFTAVINSHLAHMRIEFS
jgi:hypothetical protein